MSRTRTTPLICLLLAAVPLFGASWALPATDGQTHSSAELPKAKATVLIFLAIDCPIANRYSPLLHRLETQYRASNIRFLGVFSDPNLGREAARRHLAEYDLEMPGVLDPTASLARETGAHVTPEAVVLSPTGAVLYRGRIDNQYVAWGKTRNEATGHDLEDALNSILAGKPIAHPVTKALGCFINGLP